MNLIEVKNLNFNYDKKVIFKDLSFNIKKAQLVSVVTPSSAGKTTLLKILCGEIKTSNVFIDGELLNLKKMNKISLIFPFTNTYSKTVLEELSLVTGNYIRIKKYLKVFGLLSCMNLSPTDLSYFELQKLNLVKSLLKKSEIILIDNIFTYFTKYETLEYIGLIRKYIYDKKITVIYTSESLEEIMFCDKTLIIDKELLYEGNIDKIYSNENIIKKSKINIPLENELIEKLKLYDVIDNINYSIEEMVDEICK